MNIMKSVKVTRGQNLTLLVSLKNGNTAVNVNDGQWTVSTELRYQTPKGAMPFELTPTVANNSLLIEFTEQQTSSLTLAGTGYVLVVKADKNDGTVNLINSIPVSVVDGV
jgi:hypothetical protein